MRRPTHSEKAAVCLVLFISFVPVARAQSGAVKAGVSARASDQTTAVRVRFIRAIVVDGRLSALRRGPDLRSSLLQRLRVGRQVFIFGTVSGKDGQPAFYRVVVSRRTRGWVHRAAVVRPDRAGEDERLLRLANSADNGVDRIVLCRLLVEHFNRSPLVPRALLELGAEAERAAATVGARARKRLSHLEKDDHMARDYYLNDAGLDRYSRLGVRFDFDEAAAEYVYDGQAYRDIIRRAPLSPEARVARDRLDVMAGRRNRR